MWEARGSNHVNYETFWVCESVFTYTHTYTHTPYRHALCEYIKPQLSLDEAEVKSLDKKMVKALGFGWIVQDHVC